MIEVRASVFIQRPHAEVFGVISDFENNPRWQSGMVEAKFTSDGPLRVGSTYDQVARSWAGESCPASRSSRWSRTT